VHRHADFEVLRRTVDDSVVAGDVDAALTTLRPIARAVAVEQGAAFRKLVMRIPEDAWHTDPEIAAALGASYRAAGSPRGGAAIGYFRAAETALDSAGPERAADRATVWLGHAAALRTQGEWPEAIELADRATAAIRGSTISSVPLRVALGARAALERGLLDLHLGAIDEAREHLEYADAVAEEHLTRAERIECLGGLALLDYTAAELTSALARSAEARGLAEGTTLLATGFAAPALIAEMLVAIERDDADAAAAVEAEVVAAAHRTEWEPSGQVALAYLRFIRTEPIEALDLLQRSRHRDRSWQLRGIGHDAGELLRASILVSLDQSDEAWRLLTALDPYQHHALCPGRVVAQLRFAHGDLLGASQAIAECESLGDAHSTRTLVDVRMLRAAIEYERGDFTVSDVAADRALVTMVRTGSRAPFRGIAARTLAGLVDRARARPQSAEVRQMLTDVAHADGAARGIEPLSHRERLVLAEVERGHTVAAIAAALYISPNTVKTHLRRLYRKLGVSTRAEAIRKARSLGFDRRSDPAITRDSPGTGSDPEQPG
jgi:DNA-binding CsgD family transcriptional regulator